MGCIISLQIAIAMHASFRDPSTFCISLAFLEPHGILISSI